MDEAPRDTENDSRAPDGESSTVDQAGVDTFAAPDDPSTNIELTHAKTIEPDADFLAAQTAEDSNAPQSPDQTSAPAGGAETPEPEAHAESSETGNSIGAGADTTDEIIPPDDAESEPWSSPEAVADTVQADTFATDA
ncbi:MAG TPA: hypothetical protein VFQ70_04620 [Candidatus Saccharimonadaceae bacterium]|nr:hypothetical protein [Candidatus Saccharimonadaceae bacterium]